VSHRAVRFTNSRRPRRRRLNRQQRLRRKNFIGFTSDALPASSDEEEDEAEILESSPEDDEGTSAHAHTGLSMDDMTLQTTMSISFADIDFAERIDKMGTELDALVRYLSKHTEGLASSGAEEASTFARLAFALDDWDL
jgi:gamma-tubulin complex component 5